MASRFAEVRELQTLYRHSTHYFIGMLGSMAVGFFSFPLLTRLFSVADYGVMDLVQKYVTFLLAFSKLGLQHAVLRFYDAPMFSTDRNAERTYFSTMFFGSVLTSGLITFALVALVREIPNAVLDTRAKSLMYLASPLVFLGSVESVQWAFLRIEERTRAYSASLISLKAGALVLTCALIWLGYRTIHIVFAAAIGVEALAVVIVTVFLVRRDVLRLVRIQPSLFRAALTFGLPMIIYEMAYLVLDSGDRVLVRYYIGPEALGRYSVAYSLSGYIHQLALVPLTLAVIPIYLNMWATKGREQTVEFLSQGLDWFVMIAAGLLCGVVVTSRDTVIILASAKYHGADHLIPTLAGGLLIFSTYVFISAGLLIDKKTLTMAKVVSYAALLNVAMNCLLLPRIGLQGAAIATLVSYAFCIAVLKHVSFRILPLRIRAGAIGRYVVFAALSAALVSTVELRYAPLNLVVRGFMSIAIYGGLLCLTDTPLRALIATVRDGRVKSWQRGRGDRGPMPDEVDGGGGFAPSRNSAS